MTGVTVVIGAGSIGQAIARRVNAGRHVLLADLNQENADRAAETLADAGFETSTATVDIAERAGIQALIDKAAGIGDIERLVHAAGVSPSQAPIQALSKVDLHGTAVLLELFGNVIAEGGSGIVIASQSEHRLPALTSEQDEALATTPADDLLGLNFLAEGKVENTLHAYQLSKRANALRVAAEAVKWGERDARLELPQPRHRHHAAGAGRAERTSGRRLPQHVREEPGGSGRNARRDLRACNLRNGTGRRVHRCSDFLIDGDVTASFKFGRLRPE